MACYCFLRCVHDQLVDNKTPFEKSFNAELKGPSIPFGAQIEYKPSRDTDIQRLHPLGKNMLSCIFIGYDQHAGADGPAIYTLQTGKKWTTPVVDHKFISKDERPLILKLNN